MARQPVDMTPATIDAWVNAELPENFSLAIVPIARGHSMESLTAFATGTLLRVAEESFLVTAAHVISDAEKLNSPLAFGVWGENKFLKLIGAPLVTPLVRGHWYDLCIWKLPAEIAERVPTENFLRFSTCSGDARNFENRKSVFRVYGFPCEGVSKDASMHFSPFTLTTHPFRDYPGNLENYDPDIHMLFDVRPEGVQTLGDHGAVFPTTRAQFEGISGCPVWEIPLEIDAQKTMRAARIVGVETCVFSTKGVMRATHWNAVLRFLAKAFPEVRPAASI